jgi:AraC family transcriptional regulator, transcriptional activator of pobA
MNKGDQIEVQRISKQNKELKTQDEFLIIYLGGGIKSIQVDFTEFEAFADMMFFISPGMNVDMDLEDEYCGWILKVSKNLLKSIHFEGLKIRHAELFTCSGQIPRTVLSPKIGERVQSMVEMIDELAGSQIPNKENGMYSLLKTIFIYCESKCNVNFHYSENNERELQLVTTYKNLVASNYNQTHKVSDYAKIMHISPKYLNYAVKNVLQMTAKNIVQEQLIIEARRELKFSNRSIKEIAYNLGFSEPFHFSNFFKKMIGCAPTSYRGT